MTLNPPKFCQFYARSIIWASLVLLPIWWLNSIFYNTTGIGELISALLNKVFIFGYIIINFICQIGEGCFVSNMDFKQQSFFAYFFSTLALAFVIALYKTWAWQPEINYKNR